jgi:hypothetical protein
MSDTHPPCSCPGPAESCPRYGFMMGRRHQVCQGVAVDPGTRDSLLDAWAGQPAAPGPARKAVNFAFAAVGHALSLLREANSETRAARLAACLAPCEMWDGDERNPTCRHPACGCPLLEKTKWASETCPLGKWPAPTVEGSGCGGCGRVEAAPPPGLPSDPPPQKE